MWNWTRKHPREGFPKGFSKQPIGSEAAKAISRRPPPEIAIYFRQYPEVAKALLNESYDKRYSPSSFIEEENGVFRVAGYECIQEFSDLEDAAADYLLFSLGKGRWKPEEKQGDNN